MGWYLVFLRFTRRWRRDALVLTLVILALPFMAGFSGVLAAQDDAAAIRLRLRRDLGFGSGAQVQGRFSMLVDGAEDVMRVEFYIDDQLIGADVEAPFRLRFNTGDYELGWHSLRSVAFTADGRELTSNTIQRQFVSGSTSTYVVVGVIALLLGFRLISYLVTRDKKQGPKKGYGIYGGAVCPRCGRPFSRHVWAPNLIAGKLDRCPHCGKWHFATRATPQTLASAERFADELDAEEGIDMHESDEEELLRKRLDESRFDD